jgi:hypothetical protein
MHRYASIYQAMRFAAVNAPAFGGDFRLPR